MSGTAVDAIAAGRAFLKSTKSVEFLVRPIENHSPAGSFSRFWLRREQLSASLVPNIGPKADWILLFNIPLLTYSIDPIEFRY
jgi:hypothetical protein